MTTAAATYEETEEATMNLGSGVVFVVDADDPLFLIHQERFELVIRMLGTRDAVESLLGQGVDFTPDGNAVRYQLLPSFLDPE